jgi:hypothetical protein
MPNARLIQLRGSGGDDFENGDGTPPCPTSTVTSMVNDYWLTIVVVPCGGRSALGYGTILTITESSPSSLDKSDSRPRGL